jgi:Kef-type K+ transport system membrane component KefB
MKLAYRLVVLLLLLQGTATVTLWTLNPTDPAGQDVFAILLGVDLLGFALISYLYRSDKTAAGFSRPWVLVGCAMFVILLLAVLVLA